MVAANWTTPILTLFSVIHCLCGRSIPRMSSSSSMRFCRQEWYITYHYIFKKYLSLICLETNRHIYNGVEELWGLFLIRASLFQEATMEWNANVLVLAMLSFKQNSLKKLTECTNLYFTPSYYYLQLVWLHGTQSRISYMWSHKLIVFQCLSACKVARSSVYLYFLASLSELSFDLIQKGESINVTAVIIF